MTYIFKININTDGDFCLPFVPRGMNYEDDYIYTFKKVYTKRDLAVEDVIDICSFLKENIFTSRDLMKERWDQCIDNFIKSLKESTNTLDEYVEECMGGNYEGTEFIFCAEPYCAHYRFYLTDEERELIQNNKDNVTVEMLKEALLTVYRNNIEK